MIRIATDVESAVVAAERIDEYSNVSHYPLVLHHKLGTFVFP